MSMANINAIDFLITNSQNRLSYRGAVKLVTLYYTTFLYFLKLAHLPKKLKFFVHYDKIKLTGILSFG